MGELLIGLAKYFVFYNAERPHQSLGNQTPQEVHKTSSGGGAMIVDKYRVAERLRGALHHSRPCNPSLEGYGSYRWRH
jgi:putative transposase